MCELVYDQVKMPFPEKKGVLAQPGLLTSIGVQKVRCLLENGELKPLSINALIKCGVCVLSIKSLNYMRRIIM